MRGIVDNRKKDREGEETGARSKGNHVLYLDEFLPRGQSRGSRRHPQFCLPRPASAERRPSVAAHRGPRRAAKLRTPAAITPGACGADDDCLTPLRLDR